MFKFITALLLVPSLLLASSILEAENATVSGGQVATNYAGYTGTGYVDFQNKSDDYVEWTYTTSSSVVADIDFRYALAYGDRPLEVSVNGVVVAPSLDFPNTGSWTKWVFTQKISVSLISGDNIIKIRTTSLNGGNVDYLRIEEMGSVVPAGVEFFNDTLRTWYVYSDSGNASLNFMNINSNKMSLGQNGTLRIEGTIKAEELFVTRDVWADYVFNKNYALQSLSDVDKYIKTHGHLPGIPSKDEISDLSVGSMQVKLLEKVEELTLHMIRLEKENIVLKNKLTSK